jgi:hypothetical protein
MDCISERPPLATAGRHRPGSPRPSPRTGAWRCATCKARRQPPLPNPPKKAKRKPGASLTRDKSRGQRHRGQRSGCAAFTGMG